MRRAGPGDWRRAPSPRSRFAESPSPRRGEGLKCASAHAAAAVGAIAIRAVRPSRAKQRWTSATSPLLAAEQMRDSADVEPQPVAVHLDQRRPAAGPAREPLHQRRIAGRIGGNRDQRRIERAGVGQPRTGPRAAFGGGLGDRMDDQPVRALDGEDDRRVRRISRWSSPSARSPAAATRWKRSAS